ncbi:MAG TPA: lipoate--protein ligase family protein [Burkholderiaceae bacterium]|nr:lipoate--protein ligase family protein [Burkholderiaceae bacterium]
MFRLLPADGEARHARHDESLIALAAEWGPHACIWEAEQGLVVPRTYQRFSRFSQACSDFAEQGWPIAVRQSGGGIVPQGPGIVNLSLAYAVQGKPLDHSDQAYLLICRIVSRALEEYGVAAHAQAVEGSFCDGRYNLAVGVGGRARKVAGTAQLWRRHRMDPAQDHCQIVLVHALILASVDIAAVTLRANGFEQAIGSGRRYVPDSAVSLSELCAAEMDPRSLTESLKQSLARKIAAI